jgi:hypothetical protein
MLEIGTLILSSVIFLELFPVTSADYSCIVQKKVLITRSRFIGEAEVASANDVGIQESKTPYAEHFLAGEA